jgi:hypothetical protein
MCTGIIGLVTINKNTGTMKIYEGYGSHDVLRNKILPTLDVGEGICFSLEPFDRLILDEDVESELHFHSCFSQERIDLIKKEINEWQKNIRTKLGIIEFISRNGIDKNLKDIINNKYHAAFSLIVNSDSLSATAKQALILKAIADYSDFLCKMRNSEIRLALSFDSCYKFETDTISWSVTDNNGCCVFEPLDDSRDTLFVCSKYTVVYDEEGQTIKFVRKDI